MCRRWVSVETLAKQKPLSARGKSVLGKLRREVFQAGISSGEKRGRGNNTTTVQAEELQLSLWNVSRQASKAAPGPARLSRWILSEVL